MTAPNAVPTGMSELQFTRRLMAAATGGLLALVVMAGTAGWLVSKANSYAAWVEHTYAAETKILQLQSTLEAAETARRGYLLVSSPTAWRNYETNAALVPDRMRDLQDFVSDNPRQIARMQALHGQVEHLLGMMSDVMVLAQTGDRDRAIALFRAGQELKPMQQARRVLSAMLDEEARLLSMRLSEQAAYSRRLLGIVLAGAALLALLAGGALWTIRRYADGLTAAQDALRKLNVGLEEEVRVRTADLTRVNAEIQRFAYIVSHDLRSPLVNVLGFTSELEVSLKPLKQLVQAAEARGPDAVSREAKQAVEEDVPEAIAFIRSSTQKMDRLINAILKLSREGRRTLTPETIDMTALANTVADSLRTLAHAKGAQILVEGPLPEVRTDRLAAEQVLSNLMENAVKYLAPGRPGRVVVRGGAEPSGAVFEVEDNGRGLDPKDHERIFDLFRRAGAQDQPGEGIGLAHVRALVNRLGGRIEVSSELDRGATFRLLLPTSLTVDAERPA